MRLNLFLLTAVLASSLSLDFAAAQPQITTRSSTEYGHITSLETGWIDDSMAVKLDVPFVNSRVFHPVVIGGGGSPLAEFCTSTNSDYALNPKDPGVKVHEAVLLSAFLTGRKVRLLLEGCIYDKPRIISVMIDNAVH